MEIRIERKELQEGLSKVSKAITGKVGNAILDMVNIVAENDSLKLTGSDSNLTIISTTTEVQVLEPGNIVVEPRILGEIIRRLPEDTVHIKAKENTVEIKCQKSDFIINYNESDAYPSIEIANEGEEIELNEAELRNMVKSVSFAAANDEARPVLKGIYFELSDGFLNFVALDGYRLAKKSVQTTIDKEVKAIVEAKSFMEATRLMNDSDEVVKIKVTQNHIVFTFGQTVVMSRLLEGNYVNYKSLMRTEFSLKVKTNRSDLIGSLERASLMSENGNKLAKLTIGANEVNISAKSQLGQVVEDLPIETDGDANLTIAFNVKYLLDALKAIEDVDVILDLVNPVSPCVIKGAEDITGEYLVLPVRLV